MAETPRWRLLVPRPVRELPADLAVVIALTVVMALSATLPVVRETPLRIALGLPFALFFPGYAFVAALFPEEGEGPVADADSGGDGGEDRGIDGIERVALSFGLSIAITPLIGLALNFTPWGIRLGPILVGIGGFTLVATAVAAQRRWDLPADERFRVPYRSWLAAGREELFAPETRADLALNVLLVASILLAMGSVGFAIAFPSQGETFTEFYLLTEDDDGELVADDYPTEFVAGESQPVVVGVANQEHDRVNYDVVVQQQAVAISSVDGTGGENVESDDGSANDTAAPNRIELTVEERTELERYSVGLDHNRTDHRTVDLGPTTTGENLRLKFLLYNESAPAEPTAENAYRDLHLWMNVTDGS